MNEWSEEHDRLVTKTEEYVLQAESVFAIRIDIMPNTEIRMIESDHGYAEWLIAPLYIADGNGTDQIVMVVDDAGESQRRYRLMVQPDDSEPYLLIHSYFDDDGETRRTSRRFATTTETYEISSSGKTRMP